ncbi:MAG: DHH family phosphoesterase [Bulleidia sp.]
MQQKMNKMRRFAIIAVVVQILLLFIFRAGLDRGILSASVILIMEVIILYLSFDRFEALSQEEKTSIREAVGSAAQDAFLFSQTGMVLYDDAHIITWMSQLFADRGINRIGIKVLSWLPEAEALIDGSSDTVTVQLDNRIYSVARKEDEPVLFFRDITDLDYARRELEEGRSVIGMASLDNFEESTQFEDDNVATAIAQAVRTPFYAYCKEHGILVKRVNSYSYFLVLNEKIFADLAADHFSILNTVRKAAQKQDVPITLSMAFARGRLTYEELDDTVNKLMDLAQNRGGDQVAVQKAGEDVVYFGGSSEATEKRSRVRVRVMAHTLRELITHSSNVIICGHRNMDFDCMGSALGAAHIANALHKPVVLIAKTGGIEEKLNAVVTENYEELNEEVRFVTENEAINQLGDKTLVIMVDHHMARQSNGSKLLESAKQVAIIDHHRRSSEMGVRPVFVYIEAGASSASELIVELLPYISNRIELSALDANIMLAGIMIDTMQFHTRTGARTFDAASLLRQDGADPRQVDSYLKDSYDEFFMKSKAIAMSRRYEHGIVVCPVKGMTLTRSMMSQVADAILGIADVEAAFVLADDTDRETAISARSNGHVNVQVIMEKMDGGGHMTAAAMQRERCDLDELQAELLQTIEAYFKEGENDESHSEK